MQYINTYRWSRTEGTRRADSTGTWFTFRILTAYWPFTLVSIIGILDADNWYVPIIDGLRYLVAMADVDFPDSYNCRRMAVYVVVPSSPTATSIIRALRYLSCHRFPCYKKIEGHIWLRPCICAHARYIALGTCAARVPVLNVRACVCGRPAALRRHSMHDCLSRKITHLITTYCKILYTVGPADESL